MSELFPDPPYRERLPASPFFRWAVRAILLIPAGIVAAATLDESASVVPGLVAFVALLALVVVLDRWLLVLDVDVDHGTVVVSFGPIHKRIAAGEIRYVLAEGYRWMQYGGWGIRWAPGKRRAWTVPFETAGVLVVLRDGTRYFISSRSPERLREAIEQLIDQPGGIRG